MKWPFAAEVLACLSEKKKSVYESSPYLKKKTASAYLLYPKHLLCMNFRLV